MKIPTFKSIFTWFRSLPIVCAVVNWLQNNSLPGFFNVPLYDVYKFIQNELRNHHLTTRANSMSFSFFLSLFPLIISVLTLIPYLLPYFLPQRLLRYLNSDGEITLSEELNRQFRDILPENVLSQLGNFISDVSSQPRFGLFSIGFILAIYFSSNGIMTMMRGFTKSTHETTFFTRNAIMRRLVSFKILFLLILVLLSSIIFVILGNLLIGKITSDFNFGHFTSRLIYILRWIIITLLFYTGISLIYRNGASTHKKFQFFSPGATLATLLSLLSSVVFSVYVDNFGQYNQLYGGIGSIIVIMLWIQINSFIVLLGFELNAAIAVNRDLKTKKKLKS